MKTSIIPPSKLRVAVLIAGMLCLHLASAFAQTLTTGLVGYWSFDTVNGTTTPDLALGNNLNLIGSPSQVPSTITVRNTTNCFTFNGTSQFLGLVHTTNSAATGLPVYSTNGYTIALWVKGAAGVANNKTIFSEGNLNNFGLLLNIATKTGNKLDIFIRNNAGTTVINNIGSATTVFDGNWHHIAWEDNNGTCALYVDGVLDTVNFNYSSPAAGAPTGTDTSVGALYRATPVNFFPGSVDEVMCWSRILTQAEIQNAMNNGIPQPIAGTAPTFVTQPASTTNSMGDRVILSANAFGNQPLGLQWLSNGIPLLNQTNNTLILSSLTAPGTTPFTVTATNAFGTNTSNPANVVVLADPANNVPSGLVGYWPFDTISSSSSPDLVSQNNMQLVAGPGLVSGEFNNALSFDGATQYGTETTGTPIYDVSTTYTVAFWVKGAANQTDAQVFANGHINGNYFFIGTDNTGTSGKVDVRVNSGMSDTVSTNTAFDGTWHHIAWVDQNGTGLLYIDGVLDPAVYSYAHGALGALALTNTSVGVLAANTIRDFFAGDIDDLGTWNRRLTYSEIQSIRTSGIPAPPVVVKPTVGTPTISEVSVYQGDSITINAVTSGTTPSYQWFFGSSKISGVSNPSALTTTLALSDVQPGQSGTYSLVATNSAGSATNSVVLTVIPYTPVTSGTAVQVEFNWATGPIIQSGFSSMTLAANPSTFSGPEITVSPIGSTTLADRSRTAPTDITNNPPALNEADIYNQFIFSTANSPGTGIDVLIQRLAPNTAYGLTMWSYDLENSGFSDWTEVASGTPVSIGGNPAGLSFYDFAGTTHPTADFDDTFGALLTSSATGQLELQGVQDGSSATLSVFINAIRLVANPVIQITGTTVASDGNLQLTIATQYPWQTIEFQESADLSPGSWVTATDATITATHGPIVTVEFPIGSTQLFYRVKSP